MSRDYIFSAAAWRSVKLLPRLWQRFYFLLIPFGLVQVAVIVVYHKIASYSLGWPLFVVLLLLNLWLWCMLIDAVAHISENKNWRRRENKFLLRSFFNLCLLVFLIGIVLYFVSMLSSWLLIMFAKLGVNSKVTSSFMILVFLGGPCLYFFVNMLMVPYGLVVKGDRLIAALKNSIQLILPYWFSALFIYSFFVVFYSISNPYVYWLQSLPHVYLRWLISAACAAIGNSFLLLIWYDFMLFIQHALQVRIKKAKELRLRK